MGKEGNKKRDFKCPLCEGEEYETIKPKEGSIFHRCKKCEVEFTDLEIFQGFGKKPSDKTL